MNGPQSLIEILDDVVDMFEADAEADRLGANARSSLLLGGHLAVGGRGGMAAQRARVADIDEPLDQAERIVKRLGRLEAALDAESEQRRRAAAEVFLRQRVIRAVREAGVVDPGDARVGAQEIGDAAAVFDMALHAQRDGLDALQQQERAHRREHRAGGALIDAARARDIGLGAETLA